mgnify:CR=1 FL=1
MRIGCMVHGTPYRHPAVTANMAASLDIISNGGLNVGVGAGWHADECAAYGLDLLEDFLQHREYKSCRLDGSTNRVQRTVDINAFNMLGSSRFCFLMSTRAGGLGINCQTADTCILFDSDWNPQVDLQAMARVHRIGQTKVVHLYRLVSRGTVEERIVQRAEKKLYLDQMVNRGSTAQAEKLEKLGQAELLKMLTFGADKIMQVGR